MTARLLYHGAHGTLQDAISGTLPLDRDRLVATSREVAERVIGA